MADVPTEHAIGRSFFDEHNGDLWMDFNGICPPGLLVTHPELFMIEHDEPCRTMINLTRYIALVQDARR